MALQKSFENQFGNTFDYWRVMPEILVDFAARTASADLRVYATKAARDANKNPMSFRDFAGPSPATVMQALTLSGQGFETALATGDLRAAIYVQVKALPLLAGATDV